MPVPELPGEILLIVGRNDSVEIARMARKAEGFGGVAACESQGAIRKLISLYSPSFPAGVRLGGATIDCCVPNAASDCLMLGISRVIVDLHLVRIDQDDWGINRRLWERRERLQNNLRTELSNPRLVFDPTAVGIMLLYLTRILRRQSAREF